MLPRMVLVLALASGLVGCDREAPNESVRGVRLGMSPRDVRDRFEGSADGRWLTSVGKGLGASDDTVLEWTAVGEMSRATQARFEFHLGMLVAVRAHFRDSIPSPRVAVTPKIRQSGLAPRTWSMIRR